MSNFNMKCHMFYVDTRKVLNSNSNLNISSPTNLTASFITLRNFFANVQFVSIVHDEMCKPTQSFSTTTMYDIMWYRQISWFLDFLWVFLEFWNHLGARIWSCFRKWFWKFLFNLWIGSQIWQDHFSLIFF
jgi:hypothetical protein